MQLTGEQQAIINATPPAGGSLLVTAFAGTGKTFTLEQYARARPNDKILYAAFNKAIQLDAEQKMPTNVMSRTTHSLAYRACGGEYQKAGLLRGNVPLWGVSKLLRTQMVLSNFVHEVVKNFMASPDAAIGEQHITRAIHEYYGDTENLPPFVRMAQQVWEDMKSLEPRSLPMVHDGYLKLYQLSKPRLNFDYILLDEAQDTTPCVWDIMTNQTCRKIVVGDPHQQIYQWRGSIDALELVKDAENLYLSKSFRFGPDVANLANTLLHRFKGEQNQLRGLESLRTEVIINGQPDKHTLIARGNAHIFRSAASECQRGKKSLGFVGGDYRNYRFQTVLDAYHVYDGHPDRAKDPLIKSFETFEDIQEYSRKVKNMELESACQLVEEYGARVPSIVDEVKARDVGSSFSDVIYTTGHKAKGLEFPVVKLASDFSNMVEAHTAYPNFKIINPNEMNLIYVALTRGTKKLYISPTVKSFIETGNL